MQGHGVITFGHAAIMLRHRSAQAPSVSRLCRLPPPVITSYSIHYTKLYEAVTALKEEILAADGVLLITPEYNNGIPGVFKNAIDWASRPPADTAEVFGGRPVAVIGASPGGRNNFV